MKISNMTAKTSLEIQDTDILVIEDGEDTKQVTVAEFKEYLLSSGITKSTKILINQALETISKAILDAKYTVSEPRRYMMATWIGSTSGNIQIALKDIDNDHWLTDAEIFDLFNVPEENYEVKLLVDELYIKAEPGIRILDFNTEHENPMDINPTLSANNAGFIKAHFEGLTQNQIALIKYDDISIGLDPTEEYIYIFTPDPDSFANAVSYEENIG